MSADAKYGPKPAESKYSATARMNARERAMQHTAEKASKAAGEKDSNARMDEIKATTIKAAGMTATRSKTSTQTNGHLMAGFVKARVFPDQIVQAGRGQPHQEQAVDNLGAWPHLSAYDKLSEEAKILSDAGVGSNPSGSDFVYPLGSINTASMMEGEIAFTLDNESFQQESRRVSGIDGVKMGLSSDYIVRTSLNGLTYSEALSIIPVGVIRGNGFNAAKFSQHPHGESTVALLAKGIPTTWNTNRDWAPQPGQFFSVGPADVAVVGNQIIPAVRSAGTPSDKFLTQPYRVVMGSFVPTFVELFDNKPYIFAGFSADPFAVHNTEILLRKQEGTLINFNKATREDFEQYANISDSELLRTSDETEALIYRELKVEPRLLRVPALRNLIEMIALMVFYVFGTATVNGRPSLENITEIFDTLVSAGVNGMHDVAESMRVQLRDKVATNIRDLITLKRTAGSAGMAAHGSGGKATGDDGLSTAAAAPAGTTTGNGGANGKKKNSSKKTGNGRPAPLRTITTTQPSSLLSDAAGINGAAAPAPAAAAIRVEDEENDDKSPQVGGAPAINIRVVHMPTAGTLSGPLLDIVWGRVCIARLTTSLLKFALRHIAELYLAQQSSIFGKVIENGAPGGGLTFHLS